MVTAEAGGHLQPESQAPAHAIVDIAKCFDKVPGPLLLRAGIQQGPPGTMLLLAFRIYMCGRRLVWDNCYSDVVYAQCGVLPGCAMA
eukprot:3446932-Pyramimonas_sp.AAC.1